MKEQMMTKEFKETLSSFLKDIGCEEASVDISKMETFGDALEAMKDNSEEIIDALNYECSNCEDKKEKIKDLEWDIERAEDKMEEAIEEKKEIEVELFYMEDELAKSFYPKSLDDVYKLQAFLENKDKYSISSFEDLFN